MTPSPELTVDSDWEAHWSDQWNATATPDEVISLGWSRAALIDARHRQLATDDGRLAWTAAVEAAWWAISLDESLSNVIGSKRYREARSRNRFGRVVEGMLWLRNVHAHRLVVTGYGGTKRDFFTPEDKGAMFVISPSNRWLTADEIDPDHKMRREDLRGLYDQHVAGLPLDMSLEIAHKWISQVMFASEIPAPAVLNDPTVLGSSYRA
ncbi:hypothetical protein ACLRGF_14305 [Mycetocola zhadangensis]|uniref:hypothetical protein n=1 Tax=Mycetocola zhadangensis TaxID=1164595 RepID=UPI003A4D1D9E